MNPYVRLLQQALRKEGVVCSSASGLSPRLVRQWQGGAEVLHLHWVELLYATPSLARSIRLLAAVLGGLVWARAVGCKIIYTVHNLDPHERSFPFLASIANRALFALADAWHVHDEAAKLNVIRTYGRRKRIYVVPHGSYIGAYPNNCTKHEARARLGLADNAFIYLFLGQIRRYKGVEDLISAFGRLADDTCQLLVAGNVHDKAYGQLLTQLLQGRSGIHTQFKYVPDSEVQYFMNACDICVLPYRDVTTSGAAILAFSFGKPIIVPALGGFPELAADGRGIVYEPTSRDGLLRALAQARSMDIDAAGQRAMLWAREHEWSILAPKFARIYADVLKSKGSRR